LKFSLTCPDIAKGELPGLAALHGFGCQRSGRPRPGFAAATAGRLAARSNVIGVAKEFYTATATGWRVADDALAAKQAARERGERI
jgi:hypothetical protein